MDLTSGQLIALPVDFVPRDNGCVACSGQLLLTSQYGELFELLGTTFGGDGDSTFDVPNVPPLEPLNGPPINWYMAVVGISGGVGAVQLVGQVSPLVAAPPSGTELARDAVPCSGGLAQIAEGANAALFALLGTQFGGNGTTTFGYPNIPPMAISAARSLPYYMAIVGMYPGADGDSVTPKFNNWSGLDTLLGAITMFPYLPQYTDHLMGVALCRGQIVATKPDTLPLAEVLVNRYGGDTSKGTFGLPHLPDGPGGLGYAIVTEGTFPIA